MKTVLYINNDKILILSAKFLGGNLKIVNKINIPLPEQSAVNGVIINQQAVAEALSPYRKLLFNCTVLINSSNIFVKKLDFPNLTKTQMISVIKSEFSLSIAGNVLYDANVYRKKGLNEVICSAVPVELLKVYNDTFKAAKIIPGKIDVMQNAVIKLAKRYTDELGRTFAINIIEGTSLVSVLFEEGSYLLTNRSAVFPDMQKNEYIEQLTNRLSSLIQFNKSEKLSPIGTSYYIGLENDDLQALRNTSERLGVTVSSLDGILGEDFPAEFFHPFVAVFGKQNDMNLLKKYREQLRDIRVQKDKKITESISAAAVLLILVFGIYGYFYFRGEILGLQNTQMTNHLSEPDVRAAFDDTMGKISKTKELEQTVLLVEGFAKQGKLPEGLNAGVLGSLVEEAAKSVNILNISYNADDNKMLIEGVSADEYSASTFVANIRATGVFAGIEYHGYTLNSINEYAFNVWCTLK